MSRSLFQAHRFRPREPASRANQVSAAIGTGSGVLLDLRGEIGRVSMSVILVPFPKAAPEAVIRSLAAAN